MKVRKTIVHKPFKEYFHYEQKFSGWSNLHWNTEIFNNLVFCVLLCSLSVLLGWFWPVLFALSAGLLSIMFYMKLKTRVIADGLSISRSLPTMAREKDQIEIRYVISNATNFALSGLGFREEFEGTQSGHFLVSIDRMLPPHTRFEHVVRLRLDGGMGIKTLPPFTIDVQDEFRLFSCQVTFNQTSEIEVYPLIESSPTMKSAISPDTIHYGFYEVAKRGDSNLFIGTRDYRQGDPVKHINWKLTKKFHKIVVNEFEKNTNSFITLLLDLHLDNQSGVGERSTWEAAKDLALSITANEIRKNNQIQVISSNLFIPFDSGHRQLITVERHFTHHELENTSDTRHLNHLTGLPPGGQIYYICPRITSRKVLETMDALIRLRYQGHHVLIFTLDPYDYLYSRVKDRMKTSIRTIDTYIHEEFIKLEKKLANVNIRVINIEVKARTDFNDPITRQATEFIDK